MEIRIEKTIKIVIIWKTLKIWLVLMGQILEINLLEWYIIPYYNNRELYHNREYNEFYCAFLCFNMAFNYTNKKGKENKAYRKRVLSGKE